MKYNLIVLSGTLTVVGIICSFMSMSDHNIGDYGLIIITAGFFSLCTIDFYAFKIKHKMIERYEE